MTIDQEKAVLTSLYDRLYDVVRYSPAEMQGAGSPEVYFQMTKNTVLDPEDFANLMSPVNPSGDQRTAEVYSALVDVLPSPGSLWSDSGNRLSQVVINVLGQANTDNTEDPKQKKTYELAYKYLNKTVKTTSFTGATKSQTFPSDVATDYDTARSSFVNAVAGYRVAYNSYKMDDPVDQRQWNAVAPMLQHNIDQTWNEWGRADKAEVEEAQQALASTINNAVSHAIEQQQQLVSGQYRLPSSTTAGQTWLPSYAMPSDWASRGDGIRFSLSSSNLNQTSSSSAQEYGAALSGSYGLFHASGGVHGEHEETHAHMDAQSFTLTADLSVVQILRPWFNPLLLKMSGWWVTGVDKGMLSDGSVNEPKEMMPLMPTGFVVARNVSISADFSTQDQEFIKKAISTEVSAGWGPFSISGNYSNSSTTQKLTSTFADGKLTFGGLQLIGWISTLTPASPPMSQPPRRS